MVPICTIGLSFRCVLIWAHLFPRCPIWQVWVTKKRSESVLTISTARKCSLCSKRSQWFRNRLCQHKVCSANILTHQQLRHWRLKLGLGLRIRHFVSFDAPILPCVCKQTDPLCISTLLHEDISTLRFAIGNLEAQQLFGCLFATLSGSRSLL